MNTRSALAVVLAALVVAVLPAESRGQQIAHAANTLTELDSVTKSAVLRELTRARSRGLPVEPLMAKVREGQIKRAPAARIQSAVVALALRLDSARAALGPSANAAEIVAGADALGFGADGNALRTVRSAGAPRDLVAPLGVLAQLIATGVPTRRATDMIVELLKREVDARQVLAFGMAVESDVGAGVPAVESATFRLRAIESSGLVGGDRTTVTAAPQYLDTKGAPSNAPGSAAPPRPRRKP